MLEAMAYKVPIICSDIPVLHEVGFNYPKYLPRDDLKSWSQAISNFKSDNDGNDKISDDILKNFTPEIMAQKTLRCYESIQS